MDATRKQLVELLRERDTRIAALEQDLRESRELQSKRIIGLERALQETVDDRENLRDEIARIHRDDGLDHFAVQIRFSPFEQRMTKMATRDWIIAKIQEALGGK